MEGEKALRAFGEISIEVVQVAGSDDRRLVELSLSATNDGPLDLGDGDVPPTGRRIAIPMVWSLNLDADGRVIEERDHFDTGLFMRQLGFTE